MLLTIWQPNDIRLDCEVICETDRAYRLHNLGWIPKRALQRVRFGYRIKNWFNKKVL